MERDTIRSLKQQSTIEASLFGCEGFEKYEAACEEANPQKTPGVPKPRLQLEEMEEKTVNHGITMACLMCLTLLVF